MTLETGTVAGEATPEDLRTRLLDTLVEKHHIRTHRVEEAMRKVERHLFLPGVPVEEAYADTHVVTKWVSDDPQKALSSASAPWIVADMLEDLNVQPGHRVLEIGAGTGYNAALLAELVGPSGSVTTVDIDPDVTASATANLAAAGYTNIHLITGDGGLGHPAHAPYDRIIVTAGCWDIPAAFWEQLTDPGRLVLPLRWRGDSRIVAFTRHGQTMVADRILMGGFIPMRDHHSERVFNIGPHDAVTVSCDPDQDITPEAIADVFEQERVEAWSDATVGDNESWDVVWLRISSLEPGACRLMTSRDAKDAGRVPADLLTWTFAIVSGASLAYMTTRPVAGDGRRWELGGIGYGPAGPELADRIRGHIRAWSPARTAIPSLTARQTPLPTGTVHPVIPKPGAYLVAEVPL